MSGVSGVVGAFRFEPKIDVPAFDLMNTANRFEGFAGDGDYVVLPTTATGALEYRNAAGTLIWSKSYTDVSANFDHWSGFSMGEDGLLYVAARRTLSLEKHALATINAAGTVNLLISEAVAVTNFSAQASWASPGRSLQPNGDGNFTLISGAQKIVFDTVALDIESDPVSIFATEVLAGPVYDAGGVYVSGRTDYNTSIQRTVLNMAAESGRYCSIDVTNIGLGIATESDNHDAFPIVWKGYVALGYYSTATLSDGARFFDKGLFDAHMLRLGRMNGVA